MKWAFPCRRHGFDRSTDVLASGYYGMSHFRKFCSFQLAVQRKTPLLYQPVISSFCIFHFFLRFTFFRVSNIRIFLRRPSRRKFNIRDATRNTGRRPKSSTEKADHVRKGHSCVQKQTPLLDLGTLK